MLNVLSTKQLQLYVYIAIKQRALTPHCVEKSHTYATVFPCIQIVFSTPGIERVQGSAVDRGNQYK